MSWSSRLRNIALSQLRAIKERLDRIDAEMLEDRLLEYQSRAAAEQELAEHLGTASAPPASATSATPPPTPVQNTSQLEAETATDVTLTRSYRILGLKPGASLAEVEFAYQQLVERCSSLGGAEGSEEQQIVTEIRARVDEAYNALREALNPTAGRFDKLEL